MKKCVTINKNNVWKLNSLRWGDTCRLDPQITPHTLLLLMFYLMNRHLLHWTKKKGKWLCLSFISSHRYKLCASVSFLSCLCFLDEIIFDRRSSSTKGDTSVNPKKKLTYEEAVEKAGTFDKFRFSQGDAQLSIRI